MDLNQGDVVEGKGHNRYQYERDGCATGWESCPNSDPITVFILDRKGKPHYQLTTCIDRSDLKGVANE